MTERKAIEVKKGSWLYDNQVLMVVRIFSLNYDYYYDLSEADGLLGEEDKPALSKKGETFMIKWSDSDFNEHDGATVDFGGLDLESAMRKAEGIVREINWE